MIMNIQTVLISIGMCALIASSMDIYAQSNYLIVADTRDVPTNPLDYKRRFQIQLKRGNAIDFGSTAYRTLLVFKAWNDDTGGPTHEFAFSRGSTISYRTGTVKDGWTNWRRILTENSNGNVGIGTDTPKERLSVNGTIRAKEIKVEVSDWPDYVFHHDYSLPLLTDVEKFIHEHKHLPDFPSAVIAEEEGVNLGQMNKLLLKQIEELTLHLIQMEKRLKELETVKQ